MKKYLKLVDKIYLCGSKRFTPKGVGTYALFGQKLKFDLRNGFPIVTAKKTNFEAVKGELAGFLEGATSAARFEELGAPIWKADAQRWADDGDNLGRIYGAQWRAWRWQAWETPECGYIDQLQNVVASIKDDPESRRHLVTAHNPGELRDMCLPPCHVMFQYFVDGIFLDCIVYMRSTDVLLGLPFNISSYALLLHIIAQETELKPRKLIFYMGDCHIYLNHLEATKILLTQPIFALPILRLDETATIDNFNPSMARLENYISGKYLSIPLNVGS